MYLDSAYVTLHLLLPLTFAAFLEPRASSSKFSISQSVKKPISKSGPNALFSLYQKYNHNPPAELRVAATSNDGTVLATPEAYDNEYLSPISIGGQALNVAFDTGSADL